MSDKTSALLTALVILLLLLILGGCGDEAAPKGGGDAAAARTSSGTAPAGATAPRRPALTAARLAELATTEVPGFRRTVVSPGPKQLLLKYDGTSPNEKGACPSAYVTVEPCTACERMDVETWRALEWLKAIVPAPLRGDPDLVWDVHAARAVFEAFANEF
jgi:hypothetical protein